MSALEDVLANAAGFIDDEINVGSDVRMELATLLAAGGVAETIVNLASMQGARVTICVRRTDEE